MTEPMSRLQRLAAAAKARAETERMKLEERARQGDPRAIGLLARLEEREQHARERRERTGLGQRTSQRRGPGQGGRHYLDPEAVVATALDLLDEKGLDGVTVRELAGRLHVQGPALYWHFRSKRDIVDAMAQAILERDLAALHPPDDRLSWRPWMREMAHALRRAMLARREGARIVAGAGFGRAKALAGLADLSLRVMGDAGFDPVTASTGTRTVIAYTFGHVIEEQAGPDVPIESAEMAELLGEFPHIAAAVDASLRLSPVAQFDMGLELILRGLETRK